MDDWDNGDLQQSIEPLTNREMEILSLLEGKYTNREIAQQLHLSYSTVKWYTQQIYGKLGVKNRKDAVTQSHLLGLGMSESQLITQKVNLPADLTPFVGRQAELEELDQLLKNQNVRLVSLIGPGGIGKTRLATQVGRRFMMTGVRLFPDGIYFVSLAPFDDATFVTTAIAEGVGFYFYASELDQRRQLLNFLRHKRLLLLLDNFEQLIDQNGLEILINLLEETEGVKILVTSRSQLGIRGEQVYVISGLDIPELDAIDQWQEPLEQVKNYSGIQMFLQEARLRQPGFTLTAESLVPVARLCKNLAGMPLGIELAAAWVGIIEPADILSRIEQSLDFLEEASTSLPERQQSLRAVFDASWNLLTKAERKAVMTVSIFRGGFSLKACEQISDLSLKILRSLSYKSWVQRVAGNRYQMHELLRQFAEEKLIGNASLRHQTQDRFSDYYCSLLQSQDQEWKGAGQLEAVSMVETDLQNIQTAWRWAVKRSDTDQIGKGLYSLCTYYEWRGRFLEGETACEAAVAVISRRVSESAVEKESLQLLIARLLIWQSVFTNDHQNADLLLRRSDVLLEKMDHTQLNVQACLVLYFRARGEFIKMKDPEAGYLFFEQSRSFAEGLGDEYGMAKALFGLGEFYWMTGVYDQSEQSIEQCLAIMRKLGDRRWIARCLRGLSVSSKYRNDLKSISQLQESIRLLEEIGDRPNMAQGILDLAITRLYLEGKFAEILPDLARVREIFNGVGYVPGSIESIVIHMIGTVHLHLGNYDLAKKAVFKSLLLCDQIQNQRTTAYNLTILGYIAILEGSLPEAERRFQDSLKLFDDLQDNQKPLPHAGLALVAHAHRRLQEAAYHICQILEGAKALSSHFLVYWALPVAALLLIDLGRCQRAIEIYNRAYQYPFVKNSKCLDDQVSQEIGRVEANLAPEIVAESKKSGETLSVWETVDDLITYFSANI